MAHGSRCPLGRVHLDHFHGVCAKMRFARDGDVKNGWNMGEITSLIHLIGLKGFHQRAEIVQNSWNSVFWRNLEGLMNVYYLNSQWSIFINYCQMIVMFHGCANGFQAVPWHVVSKARRSSCTKRLAWHDFLPPMEDHHVLQHMNTMTYYDILWPSITIHFFKSFWQIPKSPSLAM